MTYDSTTGTKIATETHFSRWKTKFEAWRDGYAQSIGELTPIRKEAALDYFNEMITNILDPVGYAVWMVPVVSAQAP
jgi:hypothetical protein